MSIENVFGFEKKMNRGEPFKSAKKIKPSHVSRDCNKYFLFYLTMIFYFIKRSKKKPLEESRG